MKTVITGVLRAVSEVYAQGLAIWDLSPKTILLQIGPEISTAENNIGGAVDCNNVSFAEIDSLRRNQFSIKIKDLGIKKRAQCQQKLVCVPDAVL